MVTEDDRGDGPVDDAIFQRVMQEAHQALDDCLEMVREDRLRTAITCLRQLLDWATRPGRAY
jgi:DNA-binding MurR/RpiR family transcriptional regulator